MHLLVQSVSLMPFITIVTTIKSITAREFFKKFPEVKKQLWGGEFWSDGGYVGTMGDGVMADTIRNYVETQGTSEEKEAYIQMDLLDFK